MNRRDFFTKMILSGVAMNLSNQASAKNNSAKKKMPVIFLGHGSPMNAIAQNDFTKVLSKLSKKIPTPKAILIVSAHWLTEGTYVTAMDKPKTIHDFGGFPEELYKIEYKAEGNKKIAKEIVSKLSKSNEDLSWGLDHGTWSVLKHIYPKANIPVIQLSIDTNLDTKGFYELGSKLQFLREAGVLIMGSGNLVHNLRDLDWNETAPVFPWAREFDEWLKEHLVKNNHQALAFDFANHKLIKRAHPSLDHYIPLIYMLGATTSSDKIEFLYEGFQNGSISMRSVMWS